MTSLPISIIYSVFPMISMDKADQLETERQKVRMLTAVPRAWISSVLSALDKVADLFVKLNLNPNAVSVLALLAGMGSGLLYALGHPVWAGVLIVVCGFLDVVDGKVAVKANKRSLYGAIFDSTLDRYSEFFIYLGLAYYFRNRWPLWILFFTFLGSTMVSYTRARAEGLGIECKVGFMQRAERMILLVLGSWAGALFRVFDQAIIGVLIVIACVSNFTAFERIWVVKKIERQRIREKEV